MPGDCWHTVDRYGELEQILCTFVHRDGDHLHGILIERDHSWHGAAIDITVVDDTEGCRKHLAKTARRDGSELLPLTHTAAHHAVKDALTAFLAHGPASPARPDVRPTQSSSSSPRSPSPAAGNSIPAPANPTGGHWPNLGRDSPRCAGQRVPRLPAGAAQTTRPPG